MTVRNVSIEVDAAAQTIRYPDLVLPTPTDTLVFAVHVVNGSIDLYLTGGWVQISTNLHPDGSYNDIEFAATLPPSSVGGDDTFGWSWTTTSGVDETDYVVESTILASDYYAYSGTVEGEQWIPGPGLLATNGTDPNLSLDGTATGPTPSLPPPGASCISTVVSFAKHTDNTDIIGGAQAVVEFSDVLNGTGSARVTIACKLLRDIHWDQTFYDDASMGDITERCWVWSRPTIIRIHSTSGAVVFTFAVEGIQFSYDGQASFWDGTVTLSGRGPAACMDYASIFLEGDHATEVHVGETRASILAAKIADGQLRQTMPFLTLGFTDTEDSHGELWTDADSIRIRSGGTVGQKVVEWAEYGWDWHVEPDYTLNLWTRAGAASGGPILWPARHFTVAPVTETWDYRSIYSTFQGEVAGGPGTGAASLQATGARFGQRESWQSQGFSPETFIAGLGALADASAQIPLSRTITVDPTIEGARPYVDYQIGDVITVAISSPKDQTADADNITLSPARVMGIAYARTKDGLERAEITLDTILEHRRRTWQNEIDKQEGAIGTPNLEGVFHTTYPGIPDEPYVDMGPRGINSGLLRTLSSAASGNGAVGVLPTGSTSVGDDIGVTFHETDGGDQGVWVMQSGMNPSGGAGPGYYQDPNTMEHRFYPPLDTGGFLPGYSPVEAGFTGAGHEDAYNTPANPAPSSTTDGSRLVFTDYGLERWVEVGARHEDAAGTAYAAVYAAGTALQAGMSADIQSEGQLNAYLYGKRNSADSATANLLVAGSIGAGVESVNAIAGYLSGDPETLFEVYSDGAHIIRAQNQSGTGRKLGFFGAGPVAQQTAATLLDVIAALQAYGLLA